MRSAAQPWLAMPIDELWGLMFGNTIKRSWMVWSNGFCPACRKPVPMYNWKVDALRERWKVACPECGERFPKNDFGAYYRTGLDDAGVFQPSRADRSLLFNLEHPGPNDPLRGFGVDDGEGYTQDGHRWRFIGAYLIYGQWKQLVVGGIQKLSAAYAVTGDHRCAERCAVLLARVADLYATMDFGKQGVMYEGPPRSGYVSTWHDACEETRQIALAWDIVRDSEDGLSGAVADLEGLPAARRAAATQPSAAALSAHVDAGILQDALNRPDRIYSNYPQTDVTQLVLESVLHWPACRESVLARLEAILARATHVDGVSGEKGMTGYTAFAVNGTARMLALFSRLDPELISNLLQRVPRLHAMVRFHVDTWCSQRFYPQIGDSGAFAAPIDQYAGLTLNQPPSLDPSLTTFLGTLWRLTGDMTLAQALASRPGGAKAVARDLCAPNPDTLSTDVAHAIDRDGPTIRVPSVVKHEWGVAILRAARRDAELDVWLNFQSGGAHGHQDGMNLGMFYRGLDMLPDFGYPPVNYGGWDAPQARWYYSTAAHNTVFVDREEQRPALGMCEWTCRVDGLQSVAATGPNMCAASRFARTVHLRETSAAAYVLDVFECVGGSDHGLLFHTGPGACTSGHGASSGPGPDFGRFLRWHGRAGGSTVTFRVESPAAPDPAVPPAHLTMHTLASGADVWLGEAWTAAHGYTDNSETWIPALAVARSGPAPLESLFVTVIEPHRGAPAVRSAERHDVAEGTAVSARLGDGSEDVWLLPRAGTVLTTEHGSARGGACLAHRANAGSYCVVAAGGELRIGRQVVRAPADGQGVRVELTGGTGGRD